MPVASGTSAAAVLGAAPLPRGVAAQHTQCLLGAARKHNLVKTCAAPAGICYRHAPRSALHALHPHACSRATQTGRGTAGDGSKCCGSTYHCKVAWLTCLCALRRGWQLRWHRRCRKAWGRRTWWAPGPAAVGQSTETGCEKGDARQGLGWATNGAGHEQGLHAQGNCWQRSRLAAKRQASGLQTATRHCVHASPSPQLGVEKHAGDDGSADMRRLQLGQAGTARKLH